MIRASPKAAATVVMSATLWGMIPGFHLFLAARRLTGAIGNHARHRRWHWITLH
jgi:hypothetical protein